MQEIISSSDELRKRCKYLKWEEDVSYWEMAEAIGMNKHSFYNFIAGKQVRISSSKQAMLRRFIETKEKH